MFNHKKYIFLMLKEYTLSIYVIINTIVNCVQSCLVSEVHKECVFRQHAFSVSCMAYCLSETRDYIMPATDECFQHLKNTLFIYSEC